MLEIIKKTVADIRLKSDCKNLQRERKNPDFHKASKIGILYDATEREEFFMVKEFFKDLKESGKQPYSLGYINFNEATFHPLARPEADYFFKNQLNWFGKPACLVTDNFIKEPFDILINLTIRDLYPLDYLAAMSVSGLKIGREASKIAKYCDITFKLDERADIKSFAYIIIHYLKTINA